jgi:cytochrome c peroxidase
MLTMRNTYCRLASAFVAAVAFVPGFTHAAPAEAPSAVHADATAPQLTRAEWKQKYVRPKSAPFPSNNLYSKDRELLGKTLFFDPRLSGSRFISCATCHNPALSWGDGLPKGIGHGMKELGRRSPTILNVAWADLLFWDGRAETLEEQALGPIASAGEMNQPLEKMVRLLSGIAEYKPLFDRAYPGEALDEKTVARAIATFERTVVSADAPFDKWVGGQENAIPESARRGFDLFNGKAKCAKCHEGWNFTDNGFHDIGLVGADRGRGARLPLEAMQFAFKTPTLRNSDRRAPFMHDGCESTLEQVVDFYDEGGKAKRPSLAPEMIPLKLSPTEKTDVVSFLKTLTSVDKPVEIPVLPR